MIEGCIPVALQQSLSDCVKVASQFIAPRQVEIGNCCETIVLAFVHFHRLSDQLLGQKLSLLDLLLLHQPCQEQGLQEKLHLKGLGDFGEEGFGEIKVLCERGIVVRTQVESQLILRLQHLEDALEVVRVDDLLESPDSL
jgi:hypothetical protein